MEKIIEVNKSNIDEEHICCAISEKKGDISISSKKAWLKDRFLEGLIFAKFNVRGKVFIEYIPSNYAWAPIIASNLMFINCFWVSGKYKGKNMGSQLLEYCIKDSKEKGFDGLVAISSITKKPFLHDPKFLEHKGFKIADTANPYFRLYYLPFNENCCIPKIKNTVKEIKKDKSGWILYYTNQCPHTEKYASILQQSLKKKDLSLKIIKIDSKEKAQNSCTLFTTYSLFYNNEFITNEILTEKSFDKLLKKYKGYQS